MYQPIFDGVHWHAAYALPGSTNYASVVECPNERTACNTCAELERSAKRMHEELGTDRKLRGLRVGGQHERLAVTFTSRSKR